VRSRAELRAAAPLGDREPVTPREESRSRSHDPGCRLTWLRDAPPIAFRPTPEAVYIVGTAAFPVGDDQVSVQVHVESGASLVVRSAASAVAWAGTGSSLEVDVCVEPGGRLDWQLQPLIASARCRFSQHSRAQLGDGATLRWAEEVVLGRTGEGPGWLDLRLDVTASGAPLLRHQLELGGEVPGWDGPAVLGANRAVGLVLSAGAGPEGLGPCPLRAGPCPLHPGPGTRPYGAAGPDNGGGWAVMPLDGPGVLLTAVAPDIPSLRRALAQAAAAPPASGTAVVLKEPPLFQGLHGSITT
jgi:urease accessory protein